MKYKKGYRYQLVSRETFDVAGIKGSAYTRFLNLEDSILTIDPGYAWDGPSGPMLDTPNAMISSLIHDALYQLMRMSLISQDNRIVADELFRTECLKAGMNWLRAWYSYITLRILGAASASPANKKKTYEV